MWEGTFCFHAPCDSTGRVFPIIEYLHDMATGGFAIVGGYVYRGRKSRALRGYYLYGDNVSNHMWAASAAESWTPYRLIDGPGGISSFGEDEAGELYVASLSAGEGYIRTVMDPNWRVAGVGDFDGDGREDVLWRNSATGENYVYLMNGTVIAGEGYVRPVADLNWQIAGIGDFDGDGKA